MLSIVKKENHPTIIYSSGTSTASRNNLRVKKRSFYHHGGMEVMEVMEVMENKN